MLKYFKKKTIICTIFTLSFVFLVGCSNFSKPTNEDKPSTESEDNVSQNPTNESGNTGGDSSSKPNTTPQTSSNSTSQADNKTILDNIKKLAIEGKIINSEFGVKNSNLSDIEKKLGTADKTDWVASAKGNYSTFSKHNLVFGSNKGAQIFEARYFDPSLKNLTLSEIKSAYGTPAHDVKSNGEEIIGYTAGDEYKLLFVFSAPTKTNSNPKLDHYSVLYPKGTVNSMADDPGREW